MQPAEDTEEWQDSSSTASDDANAFDQSLTERHTYLGEVDDVEGISFDLEPGHECTLPLLPVEGVVLMPGDTLPLRLRGHDNVQAIQSALRAPPPYGCLLAVVRMRQVVIGRRWLHGVGCTAELKQVKWQLDGSVAVIAKGRQRMRHTPDAAAPTCIIPDEEPLPLPPEVHYGLTYVARLGWLQLDAFALAEQAQLLFARAAPKAKAFQGDPLALSYWLAANMPLEDDTRQKLLECPSVSARWTNRPGSLVDNEWAWPRMCLLCAAHYPLAVPAAQIAYRLLPSLYIARFRWLLRQELSIMRSLAAIRCLICSVELASLQHLLSMSEAGTRGCFVNPYGYIHDMVTVRHAVNVELEGQTETENSWFPGYAWTLCYCEGCGHHLGWRFSAVEPNLRPHAFYGLRRPAVTEVQQQPHPLAGHLRTIAVPAMPQWVVGAE